MRLYIILYLVPIYSFSGVLSKILLVNVLFRHGDRAPGNFIKTCPNDPHFNQTFHPVGLGGLTNEGKLRVYNLGKSLRKSYDKFLGKVYLTHEVNAKSSDSPRARMSLQMILAGVYPPDLSQQWDNTKHLDWQPVLMSYKTKIEDTIFLPQMCEMYINEYNRVKLTPEFVNKTKELLPYMVKLAKDMGRSGPISLLDMNNLYHTFDAELAMKLPLPDWADKSFPLGNLRKGAILQYSLVGYNSLLKKLAGGVLLNKIIQDMKNVQMGQKLKKLNLYSGHELNIVMLLQALGVYNNQIPEYASSVVLELHMMNNRYYVKVLYHYGGMYGIPTKIDVLKIYGCNVFCPFDTFVKLLENVIPLEKDLDCKRIESPLQ